MKPSPLHWLTHWPGSLAMVYLGSFAVIAFLLWVEHRAAAERIASEEQLDQHADEDDADGLGSAPARDVE